MYKNSLIKSFFNFALLGAFAAILFSGCATRIPVNHVDGKLNLVTDTSKVTKGAQTPLVIGIVDPTWKVIGNKNYNGKYKKALTKAINNTVSELISAKGFKLKGPYTNIDDITYRDKKSIYLVIKSDIDAGIVFSPTSKEQHSLYYEESGEIELTGNFVWSLVEPMTGQVFIKRRIDLSSFNITEPYRFEKQTRYASGGIIGAIVDKASAPDKLYDNSEKSYTTAVNEFYAKSIEKIEKYIDREEIISFKKDILKLKGLKRF